MSAGGLFKTPLHAGAAQAGPFPDRYGGMFVRRSQPLVFGDAQMLGLRRSLNAPVVALEGRSAGPATAVVLVHQEPDGRPNLTVGVRFLEGGTPLLYSFEGDLYEASGLGMGLDAALSFAESMGFLLDDDELGPRADAESRRNALKLWEDHVEGAELALEDVLDGPDPEPSSEPTPAQQEWSDGLDDGLDDESLLLEVFPASAVGPPSLERATAVPAPAPQPGGSMEPVAPRLGSPPLVAPAPPSQGERVEAPFQTGSLTKFRIEAPRSLKIPPPSVSSDADTEAFVDPLPAPGRTGALLRLLSRF